MVDGALSGSLTIVPFSNAGIVHNSGSGLLSSSLIVDADIANTTISNAKLATISSGNSSGNIVVRDGSGNFAANMITLNGAVSNATDAATKSYVDTAISTGLSAKTPAFVVSTIDITLSGLQTIDGVTLVANDRALLTGQTDPVENGLWVAQVGAWTRPIDFAASSTVGQAYVFITSGSVNACSSWLCNTPTAVIDADPLGFSLFSLPDATTGANVGTGAGQLFKNKTGVTLNFRSIVAGDHMNMVNNFDDILIATDATSANSSSSIVARDVSGDFSAGTITASLNGSATSFSGPLVGDVTGTQGATVVSFVGGQTAANVGAGTALALFSQCSAVAGILSAAALPGQFGTSSALPVIG